MLRFTISGPKGMAAVLVAALIISGCGSAPSSPPATLEPAPTQSATSYLPANSPTPTPTTSPTLTPPSTTIAPSALPSTPPPTPHEPLSATQLTQFAAEADAFAAAFDANTRDAEKAFAQFTDDAWLADPSNADFSLGPKSQLVAAWASWMAGWPDYRSKTTKVFVSADATAIELDARGLGEFTPPGGVLHELRVVRFNDDGTVRMFELWYDSRQMGDPELVCPPVFDCPGEAATIAAGYTAAWSTGDRGRISSLYRSDATFVDSALGVVAAGPSAIADLAGDTTRQLARCTPGALYLETNDGDPATSDNTDPLGGRILGVAIVQQCETEAGQRVDKVSVLLFGTRLLHSFDLDPDQKIVSEETFYDATDLVEAGIVR